VVLASSLLVVPSATALYASSVAEKEMCWAHHPMADMLVIVLTRYPLRERDVLGPSSYDRVMGPLSPVWSIGSTRQERVGMEALF